MSEAFLERSGAASGRFLKGFGCRLGVRMRFEAASGRFLKRFGLPGAFWGGVWALLEGVWVSLRCSDAF